ncbi:AzlD domain-containing protein [Brevibacillus ginsengisoli]|uniref:AzlD domain-containing protein n=1 Tax=Brevibacillus ginsengisoli TaxID=363854 RepID=UPI003CF284F5
MSTLSVLLLFLGMAAVTYASRRAFLRLPSDRFSPRLKNGLTFIPIGIFAGLIFPSVLIDQHHLVIRPLLIVASLICLIAMRFTRNVFVSFGVSLLLVVLVSLGILPFPSND